MDRAGSRARYTRLRRRATPRAECTRPARLRAARGPALRTVEGIRQLDESRESASRRPGAAPGADAPRVALRRWPRWSAGARPSRVGVLSLHGNRRRRRTRLRGRAAAIQAEPAT